MWTILGTLALLAGAAWCLTGTRILKQRDEFGAQNMDNEIYAHQFEGQMRSNYHNYTGP